MRRFPEPVRHASVRRLQSAGAAQIDPAGYQTYKEIIGAGMREWD
jgi:hypothetical protein